MKNFRIEPIILLIIFILIPLANYVLARMRRRFEPPTRSRQAMPDMGMRRQSAPTTTPASPAPHERAQAAPASRILEPSRSHWSRTTLFRSRRDVRRVIVAMRVLGPCRADGPPD
jgi:hypothetical protein